jgi:putative membrane protein
LATRSFFDDHAKSAVRTAIEQLESQTSAEVVVTVHRQAGHYRDADLIFASLMAFLALIVLLFHDREFDVRWMPVDVALVFVAAGLFSAYTPTLRRFFVPAWRRAESAHLAGAASFHQQKIARCSGRNGMLVFVAMFERKVAVVCDLAIDPATLAEPIARLQASVAHMNPDIEAFTQALLTLGPALGKVMPRQADDVNELPDEPTHEGTA